MADIVLSGIYSQKQQQFAVQGASSSRFEADFIDATNRAIGEINVGADLATRAARVTSPTGTVTNLDVAYEFVLSEGITVHLILNGWKLNRRETMDFQKLKQSFEDGIDMIRQDIMNIAIAADTEDETDFAQLGALG